MNKATMLIEKAPISLNQVESEKREWQLWGMNILIILVLTAVVVVSNIPLLKGIQSGAAYQQFISLCGVVVLLVLFCLYVLKSKRELQAINRSLIAGLERTSNELSHMNQTLQEEVAHHKAAEDTLLLEQQKVGEELRRMARYDPLTGLPNRSLFLDRLHQALTRVSWHGRYVAVCSLDMDHYKGINDAYGHYFGDLLLKAIAERLSLSLRTGDTVARIGGDEFAIFFADVAKVHDVAKIVHPLIDSMSKPFIIENREVYSTVSAGISVSTDDGEDAGLLLQHADTALVRAKSVGRNNFQYYSEEMNKTTLSHITMENMLRSALEKNQLIPYYQPKLDLVTNHVIGFEVLIRWEHPDLGLVFPKEFVPLAEETGLIIPIGEWVLKAACVQCKAWQDTGMRDITMAVNISARQFQRSGFAETVKQALEHSGLDPHYLELELTESLMQSVAETGTILRDLKGMGVQIGVDDFGIGFSSLNYLKHLPISHIKIDQSFITGIPANPEDIAITTAITRMAHSLNMKVTAEGVEEADQAQFLRLIKCDYIQGFFIGPAETPDTVMTRLFEKRLFNVVK